ncbi:acyl-CoA dehydratase activase [Chloroflexota bacterium]
MDLGSTMTKAVVIDADGKMCSYVVGPSGAEHRRLANDVMREALEQADLSLDEISSIIATGYGRMNVPFADRHMTELTCHAEGIISLFPNVRLAIDIGGQDAKGLKIRDGKLLDFAMNDKCAAGTGRFLEVVAPTLGLKFENLGSISLKSTRRVEISNTCTVFARQEVILHISRGVPVEDIVAGLHNAIASRVVRMVKRLKIEPDVVFTGGVARNIGVVKALEENLGCEVLVPEDPLLTGALGAALMGKKLMLEAIAKGEPVPQKERRLEKVTFFE